MEQLQKKSPATTTTTTTATATATTQHTTSSSSSARNQAEVVLLGTLQTHLTDTPRPHHRSQRRLAPLQRLLPRQPAPGTARRCKEKKKRAPQKGHDLFSTPPKKNDFCWSQPRFVTLRCSVLGFSRLHVGQLSWVCVSSRLFIASFGPNSLHTTNLK